MISSEKIIHYDQIFNAPGFHHNKKFVDEEMFKYWIFKQYEHVPITKSQLEAELEYFVELGKEFRVLNHRFMIKYFSEFVEYCTIKKL